MCSYMNIGREVIVVCSAMINIKCARETLYTYIVPLIIYEFKKKNFFFKYTRSNNNSAKYSISNPFKNAISEPHTHTTITKMNYLFLQYRYIHTRYIYIPARRGGISIARVNSWNEADKFVSPARLLVACHVISRARDFIWSINYAEKPI